MKSRVQFKFPTPNAKGSNPHPLEDTDNQIPSCPDGKVVKCPGYARGGGMLKLRFDRYIMLNKDNFHNRQDPKQANVNIKNQKI